jgi:hypothetical protein
MIGQGVIEYGKDFAKDATNIIGEYEKAWQEKEKKWLAKEEEYKRKSNL